MRAVISIHALLAESDQRAKTQINPANYFYPRSPCGERLHAPNRHLYHCNISIHALLAESDESRSNIVITSQYFYPRSPCGERLVVVVVVLHIVSISIHALLAESDLLSSVSDSLPALFLSTLSLRRATSQLKPPIKAHRQFLSTLSLRRATTGEHLKVIQIDNFYPRSPCGERHLRVVDGSKSSIISIHALLAESDTLAGLWVLSTQIFLSTLSLRRATRNIANGKSKKHISIHALLAESDLGRGEVV